MVGSSRGAGVNRAVEAVQTQCQSGPIFSLYLNGRSEKIVRVGRWSPRVQDVEFGVIRFAVLFGWVLATLAPRNAVLLVVDHGW